MRAVADELFVRHGTLRPSAAVECTTLEKVKDLIANTDMIGILPRSFVQHNDVGRGLATLKSDVSRFAPTNLVFRKHDGLAPVVEAFAAMVQRTARELELR